MSTVDVRQEEKLAIRRSRWWVFPAVVACVGLCWAGWEWWADRSYRAAIMAIELEMVNGRFGIAARDLNRLLESYPDDGEVAILLGRCEQERGRVQAAADALARVKPGSELAHKAILARMRLLHDQGRFAAAELLINEVAQDPRSDADHVRVLLVPIFSQLGRKDEAARLIEAWWERLYERGEGASERAIAQLRMHIELDFKPNPARDVRAYLDEASHRAPDDDRVWLGCANLAIRMGEFDDARRWLDQCLTRRPDDAAVWSAYLNLGLAASLAPFVQQALSHLGTKAATGSEIDRLGAWLSADRGDHRSERQKLERLIGESPGDLPALDRLAQLAGMASQPEEAQAFRTRSGAIKSLRARYEHLFDRNQPVRDAEEMADLAQRLGRAFEARGFLTVEIAEDPEREDLRRKLAELRERSRAAVAPGRTLAEAVTPGVGEPAPVDARPAH